jgi:hypothetical protein
MCAAGPGTDRRETRTTLSAIDAVSGITTWDLDPSYGGVSALALSGNTIYAGGEFTSLGGQAHPGVAAIDRGTGSVKDWNPNLNAVVGGIATNGNVVYVGGGFFSPGGQVRRGLAALDARTANALPWNPNADSGVRALWLSGNTLYAGGWFTNICGQHHPYFAAITADRFQADRLEPVQGPSRSGRNCRGMGALPCAGRRTRRAGGIRRLRRRGDDHERVLPKAHERLELGDIAKGLYFVRMQSRNQRVTTKVLRSADCSRIQNARERRGYTPRSAASWTPPPRVRCDVVV